MHTFPTNNTAFPDLQMVNLVLALLWVLVRLFLQVATITYGQNQGSGEIIVPRIININAKEPSCNKSCPYLKMVRNIKTLI
jgi:hypothetical protein